MAKYVIEDTTLTGIADAIRSKNGSTNTYSPSEMATAITAISGGGSEGGSGELVYTLGISTSNWFPYTGAINTEFWAACPNGFDDVIAIVLTHSATADSYHICFPKLDAQYVIEKNGYKLYPTYKTPRKSGWNSTYPFGSTATGSYLGINSSTKKTAGFMVANSGTYIDSMGVTSTGYFCVIREA